MRGRGKRGETTVAGSREWAACEASRAAGGEQREAREEDALERRLDREDMLGESVKQHTTTYYPES